VNRTINEVIAKIIGAACLIILVIAGAPSIPQAAQVFQVVKVPLRIDYLTLAAELKTTIFTGPNGRAEIWKGSDACQFLDVSKPRFLKDSSGLVLELDGTLSLGLPLIGKCIAPFTWTGIADLTVDPYLAPDLSLKLRVTDINLYDVHHKRTLIAGHGFNLVKGSVIPRIETFEFDLKPPLDELIELVRLGAPPDVAQRVKAAADSLTPIPPVIADSDSIRVALQMTIPATAPTAVPSVSAGPLTPAEAAKLRDTLDNWDGFIVFAIEQVGLSVDDPQLRQQMFDLLMDSRYRLIAALAQPASGGPDPVRILFLDTWVQLGDIVRSAAQRQLLGNRELEFLSFISAGDALFALDEAAPSLGVRISADDLRRLARIMAPQVTTDPLAFSFNEDPKLQKMFGLSPPLELPESAESLAAAAAETPTPTASPSGTPSGSPSPSPSGSASSAASPSSHTSRSATPSPSGSTGNPSPTIVNPISSKSPQPALSSSPSPSPAPTPSPAAAASPTAFEAPAGWWILDAAPAEASDSGPDDDILSLGDKLKRVVVGDDNVSTYQPEVESLLTLTARRNIGMAGFGGADQRTYLMLVKATAWQESCWRQFIRRGNRVRFLESSTGDIGLMQINKYVWRGFYNLTRLEWDIVYNTGAGSAILQRLLSQAIAKDHSGHAAAALARSSYSAYNGGPGSFNRWRKPNAPAQARSIDKAFWAKYQSMVINNSFDIQTCAAQWASSH